VYGWRKRIGLLLPSSNTTMEPELNLMLPKGFSLHTSRVLQAIESEEELIKMADYARRAAEEVATAEVDLILYGCTSGSFLKGEEFNINLSKDLSEFTGIKVITTSSALKLALEALAVHRVCLVTPYPKETNERGCKWLESLGFQVVKIIELIESSYAKPVENLEIGRLFPEFVYAKIKDHHPIDMDAMVISCTNLRTIEIIDILEEDFRVPVVTSNQASSWAAMRGVGYSSPITGFGQLLVRY
jgi:maleate isomerase